MEIIDELKKSIAVKKRKLYLYVLMEIVLWKYNIGQPLLSETYYLNIGFYLRIYAISPQIVSAGRRHLETGG